MLSEQILSERAGNFTASENHRLMCGWDKPELPKPELILYDREFKKLSKKPLVKDLVNMGVEYVTGAKINEMWSYIQRPKTPQGLITYAQEKAIETLFDNDPSLNFETQSMKNGNEREIVAVKELIKQTGLNFVNTGENQAHIHVDGVGATPDGIVLDDCDLILTGCEIKCRTALKHSKALLIENAKDLKEIEFKTFVQMQTQMLVTGADHWYFAIFNPFAKLENMKFKYIIIGRDDVFIKKMQKRIDKAIDIKNEFLQKFSQFKKLA